MNTESQKEDTRHLQIYDDTTIDLYNKYGLPNESISLFKKRLLEWKIIGCSCMDLQLEDFLDVELKNVMQKSKQ